MSVCARTKCPFRMKFIFKSGMKSLGPECDGQSDAALREPAMLVPTLTPVTGQSC